GQVRVEREGDGGGAGGLGAREVARGVPQVREAGLQVQRDRVVGLGADAGRGQVRDQVVAVLDLDEVDVDDPAAARVRRGAAGHGAHPGQVAQPGVVAGGQLGAAGDVGVQPAELGQQHGGLQVVHLAVAAGLDGGVGDAGEVVQGASGAAVVAQFPGAFGDGVVVGEQRP